MQTITTKLYIHRGVGKNTVVSAVNLKPHGLALIGTHTVEVPIPEISEQDEVKAEIEACEAYLSSSTPPTNKDVVASLNQRIRLLKETL